MVAAPTAPQRVAPPGSPYAGIVTRAVALALDGCLLWVIALAVAGLVAVIGNLVGGLTLGPVGAVIAGAAAVGANLAYFSLSWTLAGRTFGQRMMQLRVLADGGGYPRLGRSLLRAWLMGLCLTFGGVAFVTVLFDRRRRGPHDMLTRTTVRYDPEPGEPFAGPAVAQSKTVRASAESSQSGSPARHNQIE